MYFKFVFTSFLVYNILRGDDMNIKFMEKWHIVYFDETSSEIAREINPNNIKGPLLIKVFRGTNNENVWENFDLCSFDEHNLSEVELSGKKYSVIYFPDFPYLGSELP